MKNYLKILLLPLLFLATQTTSKAQSIGCDSCTTQAKGNTKIHKAIAFDTLTPTQAFKLYYGIDTVAMAFRNPAAEDSIYFMWHGHIYNPAAGGGGGGGDVQPATQIVYGTGSGVNSSPNFFYDASSGGFQVDDPSANRFIDINPGGDYGIGDIDMAQNHLSLYLDDGGHTATINGNFVHSSTYGRMLLLDGSAHQYTIGDIDGISTGAKIKIAESSSTKWEMDILDNAGSYLDINQNSDFYEIGDINDIVNGYYLDINDVGQYVTLNSNAGAVLAEFSYNTGLYEIGDISQSTNGTIISANDATTTIQLQSQGNAMGQFVSSPSGVVCTIGDGNGVINNTKITVNDISEAVIATNAIATPTMQVFAGGFLFVNMNDGIRGIYIDPAVLLSSLIINLPPNPVDGQEEMLLFGGAITGSATPVVTLLTISPNSGQTLIGSYPSSANTSTVVQLKYRKPGQWYRID